MERIVRLEDFIKTEIHPLQTNMAPENGSLKRGEFSNGKTHHFQGPVMFFLSFRYSETTNSLPEADSSTLQDVIWCLRQ